MTTRTAPNPASSSVVAWDRRRYWLLTGLLLFTMGYSAVWTLVDPQGSYEGAERLGFPGFIAAYPLAMVKLAAIVVIVWRRWPVLTLFAYAGFLYDLVLALLGHIGADDFPYGLVAVLGLVFWCGAFWVERDRVTHEGLSKA
ncbi:MAG: DoxX family protein [Nocardioides sp.]